MKLNPLLLFLVVLSAAGGIWIGRSVWPTNTHLTTPGNTAAEDAGNATPSDGIQSGRTLQPPDPNRRFRDLSPEQRVKLARRGPIGG